MNDTFDRWDNIIFMHAFFVFNRNLFSYSLYYETNQNIEKNNATLYRLYF